MAIRLGADTSSSSNSYLSEVLRHLRIAPAVSEYCFTSPSVQLWQYRDRKKPEVGTVPYSYRMTSRVLYSTQFHRQQDTSHTFEQFRTLYMNTLDDRQPTRPRFEPRRPTSEFRVTTGSNVPSRPVECDYAQYAEGKYRLKK